MFTIAILIFLCVVLLQYTAIVSNKTKKIFGVYSQPGKWYYLKYICFLVILNIRFIISKFIKTQSVLASNLNEDVEELEKPKSLSSHEKAFDAVFFQAVNTDGYYLCGGVEKRHNGKINGLFYIVVPELGLLRSVHLPKTTLDADPEILHQMKAYGGEGIYFAPIEPMKKWKIIYNGKMWIDKPENTVDIYLDAEWTSNYSHFMFDTGMSKSAIARAIAKEKWSKDFFKNLKDAHQTHYEQMGFLRGTLTIDGNQKVLIMSAFRDHSFGNKRDWALMHRYAFHMMYLEDNTRVCLGIVSQPCTTSHLEMGYLVTPRKVIHPIESCDLLLYQHGESGQPGKDIAFSFVANKNTYKVKAITKYECTHFKGNDTDARLIERFLTYEVNGVRGRGISEWHYNNIK